MTTDEYKKTIYPLLKFEYQSLPIMIIEQIVPYELLFEKYPEVVVHYLNHDADTGYRAKDFRLTKYSFVFREGAPYYVAVCHFPFTEDKWHMGLAKRLYLVLSEKLTGVHLFLETYKEKAEENSNEKHYDVLYVAKEEDGLTYCSVCERERFEEEELAQECAYWSYLIEHDGIIGERKKSERKPYFYARVF